MPVACPVMEAPMPTLWTPQPDGTITITPHTGQQKCLDSLARFVFALAGSQGGKTSLGPIWLAQEILGTEHHPGRGPGDYLAVTSTFPLLKLKMLPEFLRLFKDHMELGYWRAVDKVFEFSRAASMQCFGQCDIPTRIIFGSAVNANSLESATAKGAWLDEVGQDQFRLESWEAVQRRLTLHRGRVFAGTTIYNLGWLKHEVYDRWVNGDKNFQVIQFSSTTNPAFPEDEYLRLKASMPEWKFRMFMDGQFTKPTNLIYIDFEDDYRERLGHKVHPFLVPPEWPRQVGVDFGGVNQASLWIAHDPAANIYYIYRDSLDGNMTTGEHVTKALELAEGTNVLSWHGGSKSEGQWRRDWAAAGIRVQEPKISDVEAGIDRVISLFKAHRLFVFDTCSGLLDELGTYQRELDASGSPTEKIKDKESFHRLDALRYVVQALDRDEGGAGSFVFRDERKLKWV